MHYAITRRKIISTPKFTIRSTGISQASVIEALISIKFLYQSGMSLNEAVIGAAYSSSSSKLQAVLTDIHDEMEDAVLFSEGLARYPALFPPYLIAVVQGAEETGDLSGALGEIIEHLQWSEAIHSKIQRALRYPLLLLIMIAFVSLLIMNVIVPQMVAYLDAVSMNVPAMTSSFFAFSSFLHDYGVYIVGIPFFTWIVFTVLRQAFLPFAWLTDFLILKAPVIGLFVRQADTVRFTSVLSDLLKYSIHAEKAMIMAGNAVTNHDLKRRVQKGVVYIQSGMSISDAFHKMNFLAPDMMRHIEIAEEHGHIEKSLRQVASFQAERLRNKIEQITSFIEPSLAVIMSLLILWISLAITAPIYEGIGLIN